MKSETGIVFDTYQIDQRVIRVEVTEEAIEDFCDPRGLTFDENAIPGEFLEAALLAADKLVQIGPVDIKSVRVTTKVLNG